MEQGVVPDFAAEAAAAGLGYRLQIWLVAGVVAEIAAEIAAEFLVVRLDWGVGNLVYCCVVVQAQ